MCEPGATLVLHLCPEIIPCGRKSAGLVKVILSWIPR
jgi:hypothetical protein